MFYIRKTTNADNQFIHIIHISVLQSHYQIIDVNNQVLGTNLEANIYAIRYSSEVTDLSTVLQIVSTVHGFFTSVM